MANGMKIDKNLIEYDANDLAKFYINEHNIPCEL